ncbi:maleylpyruvate isomerase family mycothiol-dependent enzyme [Actinomadura sp. HBU206391]|uniref:maleylpyruvate isomerase family mycothiol-dependent enzyme n=1 Tax=Actinomadura sp. HBU206391 TaxID=2731692 RepID=UPI0016500DE3|nr:maleylpyruvate isomerase family mycothiol-dependent enzyme [Actinomadura sp. HBU206391]MBC6461186.1 maleylpyruvate isomerase family mycothiol-dependent enzyme [Actinomadura sp. HBU206391]
MDYVVALLGQNEIFGELIRDADPSTPVPTCPGWTIQQLFRHVGRGHRWAAQIVRDRVEDYLDPRTVRDGKPPSDPDGAIEWLHGGARTLVDAVADVGADTLVWTFLGPRPAAWWVRRRLHEATVHRADAALALGMRYELAAPLAADGITEWLDRLAAERRNGHSAPLDSGVTLHLHATDDLDSPGEWMIQADQDGISWGHGHGKATTAVRGRAVDLLLALLRRRSAADAGVQILGAQEVWTTWLNRTPL